MAQPRASWRLTRYLAAPLLAVAVVATVPFSPEQQQAPSVTQWNPLTPVNVSFDRPTGKTVNTQLLSFNDFHGNIDPPAGSGGLVNGVPAGGAEFLSTTLNELRAAAGTKHSTTVTAGDLIGGTPLVSAAFHDEPTIEILSKMKLDISSVGNHEFDEGVDELKRIQFGGCHPVDGCQDGDGFKGADFTYLASNVVSKRTGLPILLPFTIRLYDGVPVAYVGMTLEGTPGIVNPAGIASVNFRDEITTANQFASVLSFLGIRSMVLLIHEGGAQTVGNEPSSCAGFAGAITDIVAGLRPEYGVVVSGHTHRVYSCALPNSSGANSVVTSAGSFGTLVTDIKVQLDKRTRKFTEVSARNVIVENGVRNPDGTFARDAAGNFIRNAARVDPKIKTIADKYRTAVAPISNRVVGSITSDISRAANQAGESPLGDVIADGMLRYTASAGSQIALMNAGGIRADLTFANSPGGEGPGQVTFGECFTVQPFNNLVVTVSLTGAQLKAVLEQQFPGFNGQIAQRILQPSTGFTYTWSASAALGSKISNMSLNGTPIDMAATYKVATNDFVANGGDNFSNMTVATGRVTAPLFDVDSLVAYLGTGPIGPGPANRITRVA
jgi:5'-nucleotidase